MIWEHKLTNCYKMFYQLNNIIDFNFSNFDTSYVKGMGAMFYKLNLLKNFRFIQFQYIFSKKYEIYVLWMYFISKTKFK